MPERPLPLFREPDTEALWAGTGDRGLTYQVCTQCGQVVFHPRRHCTGCTEGEPEWRDSAGRGTVYTFTVIRQHGQPFFAGRVPYVVGLIDLDEGFRMLAAIAADPDSVHVNRRVALGWGNHAELSAPGFSPDPRAGPACTRPRLP